MFTTDDVIRELAERGIAVTDISDLWRFYAPLSREIVGLLMAMLPDVQEAHTQDMMVRAIGCAADPYDARVLAEVFDQSNSQRVKWAIGNTLSISRPLGVREWILDALRERRHGTARQMLCDAVVKQASREDAREVLMEVYAEMPLHAASALGRVGEQRELDFLLSVQDMAENKAQQRFIATAIRRIERRLAKPRKTARARREPRK